MTLGPQFTVYHGTGGEITGGVVNANPGAFGTAAYGVTDLSNAEMYAKQAAEKQGRLFGTVYEVEPLTDASERREGSGLIIDPKGLKVKKAVSFPLNRNVGR